MSTTPYVAMQFDDAEQQFDAAMLGTWIFLATEALFFSGLFIGYTMYRIAYPLAFAEGSRRLSELLGTINTGVLLTSSLTMALAIHSVQLNARRLGVLFLLATVTLATIFLGIKAYEWTEEWRHGLVPGLHFTLTEPTDTGIEPRQLAVFFSFYFAMTGLHGLHMIIGVCVLLVMAVQCARGKYTAAYHTPLEVSGLYWHFVDMVWVFLFPLLYLPAGV